MQGPFGMSAYTLRRKNCTGWSFAKDPRFKSSRKHQESDFIGPQSTLSPRSTSIGYRKRWKPGSAFAFETPSPDSYNIPSTFTKQKGPRIMKETLLPSITSRYGTPGPGAYDASSTIGRQSPKFSFRGRDNYVKTNASPSPNMYSPKNSLTENSAFKAIGFGYGDRTFMRGFLDGTPGPGSYNISSNFDKYKN